MQLVKLKHPAAKVLDTFLACIYKAANPAASLKFLAVDWLYCWEQR